MKALIMRSDPAAAAATARVFVEKGFQILCVDRHDVACALVKMDLIDLLVMDEEIEGRLTHSLALSGERHNPFLSTILLTDRIGPDADELYDLIPCLHALVGQRTSAPLLGQLAVASVSNKDAVSARVARNVRADAEDEEEYDFSWAEADLGEQPDGKVGEFDDIPAYADVAAATPALADHPVRRDDRVFHADIRVPVFESFANRSVASANIAQVSIIGEGRPSGGVALQ